ncbi:LysM peptidoglycan-binding domain-containing protein [Shewanella profunda]|uniref:LysM peptidoglycan-binding domain-containing protein n=1 Tax=Shewanella profunda TaxID=254793 RepID=UPI00200D3801|nr:LysM peptidoglycan-binding domain-containing protein [Shewanella profunda]MCL1091671.1 LysM peptidoglycan-binding domain-containing protein [Shewanella profunda]
MRVSLYIVVGGFALLTGCQTLDNPEITKPEVKAVINPNTVTPFYLASEIESAQITDVWERIRQGMQLPIPDQKLVNQYRDWYIKNPKHLEIISERAAPYMYMIVEELEKRHLPIEIALLPIIESAFDPSASSASAASGLWQFTTPMASHFGLEMNWWYDGRRDVPASTIAALDMLEYLYDKTNNNWLYAFAAYNSGESRVLNAIKHNEAKGLKTDFWSLNLPKETKRYVPQLLALAEVIKHADEYGIALAPIENTPSIEVVDIDSQIDLAMAAGLANMTTIELQRLNPGYNRWATSPLGPHTLVLPIDKSEDFKKALAETESEARMSWLRYTIKSGDSIGIIAKKHHTTIAAIRETNGMKNNTIVAGKHLIIPVSADDKQLYAQSTNQKLPKKSLSSTSTQLTHKVQSGDTLWEIAKKYNVTVKQLTAWNHLNKDSKLQRGQKLAILAPKNTETAAELTRTVSYKVKSGDSLARIASKFKVTITELLEWNSLTPTQYLQPGQVLKLVVDESKLSA